MAITTVALRPFQNDNSGWSTPHKRALAYVQPSQSFFSHVWSANLLSEKVKLLRPTVNFYPFATNLSAFFRISRLGMSFKPLVARVPDRGPVCEEATGDEFHDLLAPQT